MMCECRQFGYKEVSLEIDVMEFMKEDHLMWKQTFVFVISVLALLEFGT